MPMFQRKKKKKKNKVTAEPSLEPDLTSCVDGNAALSSVDRQIAFNHHEVERRIAAIQAIQEAAVHNVIVHLRMLRSYLNEEQLQTPALEFFLENFPSLSVIRNEEDKVFELKRNEQNCGGNGRASGISAFGGLQFSAESVKRSFLNAASLQVPDFVLDGAFDTHVSQIMGMGDTFQTPGGFSNRSSFGMTPKTTRQPVRGEMLLSVRGSPLGVYKEEDHLDAIQESGNDSHECSGKRREEIQ